VIHPMQFELEQAYHLQRQQESAERRRVATTEGCTGAQTSVAGLLRQFVHAWLSKCLLTADWQKS